MAKARTLTARARALMKRYAMEELALVVSYYERKDAEIEAGICDLNALGPDNDERLRTLRRLLAVVALSEQKENAHGRR